MKKQDHSTPDEKIHEQDGPSKDKLDEFSLDNSELDSITGGKTKIPPKKD